jgi:hypothetical protein
MDRRESVLAHARRLVESAGWDVVLRSAEGAGGRYRLRGAGAAAGVEALAQALARDPAFVGVRATDPPALVWQEWLFGPPEARGGRVEFDLAVEVRPGHSLAGPAPCSDS